jgi:hypothetical protein
VVAAPAWGQHAVLLAPPPPPPPPPAGVGVGAGAAAFFFIWSTKMSNEASLFTRETPQPPLFSQCMPKAEHLVSPARGSKIFLSSALMASVLVLSIVLSMREPGWTMPRLAGQAVRSP